MRAAINHVRLKFRQTFLSPISFLKRNGQSFLFLSRKESNTNPLIWAFPKSAFSHEGIIFQNLWHVLVFQGEPSVGEWPRRSPVSPRHVVRSLSQVASVSVPALYDW